MLMEELDLIIALAGITFLTLGTLISYITYACLKNEFPVITFMFRDWPLVSSSTTGIGSTLLLYAMTSLLQGNKNKRGGTFLLLLSSCSLWLVIGSSNTFGNQAISWFHDIFTLFFLLFASLSLGYLLPSSFRSWKVLLSMLWGVAAVVSGFILNVDKSLKNARISLGISELLFVLTLGLGYLEVIYHASYSSSSSSGDGDGDDGKRNIMKKIFKL